MTRRLLTLTAAVLIALLSAPLAQAQAPARTHHIELDDYFTLAVISNIAPSPDGKNVAYTEARWDKSLDGRNTDLWVVETSTRIRQRLTFDPAPDQAPSWDPFGRYLYFTSSPKRTGERTPPYDGKTQVWRIWPGSSEPTPVTRVEGGINGYTLSKDGRSLYYVVGEEQIDDEFKDLRAKHKHLEYGHGVNKLSQVWKLDLESWRSEKLVDDKRVIHYFTVSPDGRRIAMITTPDAVPLSNEGWSRVDVWNAETKKITVLTPDEWRKDHPSPYGWVDAAAWSADGLALAFSLSFDAYPSEIYVAEGAEDQMPVRKLNRPDDVDLVDGGRLHWRGQSRELCFVGESHARRWVCGLQEVRDGGTGQFRKLTEGDVVVNACGFDRAGENLFMVMDTMTRPTEIYQLPAGAPAETAKRLTDVNPQVDSWKLPQIQLVSWQAPDGAMVEGILELPPDYPLGEKPMPMVVELHGGPTAATPYCLQFWIYGRTTMPAKGYALLSPNYRGSTGYGRKFMTDLVGHENDIEVQDILAGVDAMVAKGIADPQRLGVMGWSNGGFLTNCVITHTDRFKAASSGAGILDMIIQWGTEDTPGHVVNYQQGLPWAVPEAYRKASPIFGLAQVKTPTLIHVGGADPRCPPGNSRGLYRALRYYLKVPTELVVYPGEAHSLTKYENRKAKMEWDMAWFDRYVLGKKNHQEKKEPVSKPAVEPAP